MDRLGFFFSYIDHDFLLAEHLIGQIRQHFLGSRIAAVNDGGAKDSLLDCTTLHGDHLKRAGCIGSFTQRNLQFVLDVFGDEVEHVVKLDPDSFIRRGLSILPDSDWAGEVRSGTFSWGKSTWAKGGVYCIKRSVIQLIVESRMLLDEKLQHPEPFEIEQGRIYEDCRLGYVANHLDIYPVRWADVSVGLVNYRSRQARKFSILHPAKDKLKMAN